MSMGWKTDRHLVSNFDARSLYARSLHAYPSLIDAFLGSNQKAMAGSPADWELQGSAAAGSMKVRRGLGEEKACVSAKVKSDLKRDFLFFFSKFGLKSF